MKIAATLVRCAVCGAELAVRTIHGWSVVEPDDIVQKEKESLMDLMKRSPKDEVTRQAGFIRDAFFRKFSGLGPDPPTTELIKRILVTIHEDRSARRAFDRALTALRARDQIRYGR